LFFGFVAAFPVKRRSIMASRKLSQGGTQIAPMGVRRGLFACLSETYPASFTVMLKLEKYRNVLFSALAEITSLIVGGTEKRSIIQRVLDVSLVVLEAQAVILLELQGDKITRYSRSYRDPSVRIDELSETPVLRTWLIKEGQSVSTPGGGRELGFDLPFLANRCLDDDESTRVIISSPLVARQAMFGLLVAIHAADTERYAREDEQLITILANHAAVALENQILYRKLEREASTDELTGVHNYRFLINALENEIKRSARFRQFFSFMMLDVDNLKTYNDRLGHLFGSQVLRDIAQIIKANCREIDLVSKYGGDEFAVILPRTDVDGAAVVAARVLRAIEQHEFGGLDAGLLTCSAGISCFPHDGRTVRDIIANADRALYEAKRLGKGIFRTTNDLGAKAEA
jgi:diguanylate cyclase (GGDEF)-like protein